MVVTIIFRLGVLHLLWTARGSNQSRRLGIVGKHEIIENDRNVGLLDKPSSLTLSYSLGSTDDCTTCVIAKSKMT